MSNLEQMMKERDRIEHKRHILVGFIDLYQPRHSWLDDKITKKINEVE